MRFLTCVRSIPWHGICLNFNFIWFEYLFDSKFVNFHSAHATKSHQMSYDGAYQCLQTTLFHMLDCWSHHLNWCHWVQVQPLRPQHFPLYLSCTFLATDRSNRFDFSSVVPRRNAHFVFVFITPSSFPLLPWWVSVSLRFVEVKIDHWHHLWGPAVS